MLNCGVHAAKPRQHPPSFPRRHLSGIIFIVRIVMRNVTNKEEK